MPRVNLTDEEAALIERVRAKHAKDISFNEGLDEARGLARTFLREKSINHNYIVDLENLLQGVRRSIKL